MSAWRLRRWGISFAAWTALGLFAVMHAVCNSKLNGGHPGPRMVVLGMANMWLLALWTESLLWWSRRLPMERGRWLANLTGHLALSLVYSAASTAFKLECVADLRAIADPTSAPRISASCSTTS